MQRYRITFYDEDTASVTWLTKQERLEDRNSDFDDLMLFILYVIKSNYDINNKELTLNLAALLKELGNLTLGDLAKFAGNNDKTKLVQSRKNQGTKSFVIQLDTTNNIRFKYTTEGFGIFAKGVGYYSMQSVILLFRYMILKHSLKFFMLPGFLHTCTNLADKLETDIKLNEIIPYGTEIFRDSLNTINKYIQEGNGESTSSEE